MATLNTCAAGVVLRFAFALLLVQSAAASFAQGDREREFYRKNRIQKVWIDTQFYTNGQPGTVSTRFSRGYDTRGNMVEAIGYDSSDGKPLMWDRYRFDASNRLTELTQGSITSKDATVVYRYRLDERGQVVGISAFDSNGRPRDSNQRVLDANGRIAEETSYSASGVVTGAYRTRYDAAGNPVEQVQTKDGQTRRFTHSYHAPCCARESQEYDPSGQLVSRTVREYDGDRLRETREYRGGAMLRREVNRYDANGLISETTRYDGQGRIEQVTRARYEFYP